MWTRRQFVSRGVLGMLGLGGAYMALPAAGIGAGDKNADPEALPDGSASAELMERSDPAIARGLAYLASHRNRDNSFGTGGYTGNVAVTSLAALAFMAGGSQPNRGPYGQIVADALRFVLKQDNRRGNHPGFLYNVDDGTARCPMYSHGFGTLLLAETSGMVQDPALSEEVNRKLHEAVQLILKCQNSAGGWRYNPEAIDADISVTICMIMALRAARNAGVVVPKSTVDRCVQYVMDCQDHRFGYFHYQKEGGGGSDSEAFARTAAGVVALCSAGYYLQTDVSQIKDPVEHERAENAVRGIKLGLDFMQRNPPVGGPRLRDIHYFYGHYYATQAMWAAGGEYWKRWYPFIRDELIGLQASDGSWFDGFCYHYSTAMACIVLQVPNNYLPILQR
ncbi:MAG TPA: prenyltransferase/squalene oxidase repeat-containing protein [Gemmataceae bacterium]|nr:prenyltransferase/squalene oxidase repeat-containing protein [Gemmataceae bacterium]